MILSHVSINILLLADIEDEYCDDNMHIINQYMVDDDCSFAALGGGVDDLVDPSTMSEKNDKFDTFLVQKKMYFGRFSRSNHVCTP